MKIKLKEESEVTFFNIQFKGVFVGTNCVFRSELIGHIEETYFYPEDNNSIQNFFLNQPTRLKSLTFIFNSSTDFFGGMVV